MCATRWLRVAALALLTVSGRCSSYADKFHEELLLKPLHGDQLYAYFQFSTVWEAPAHSDPLLHCHLFPRALAEIVGRYEIQELHISLTGGLWRYENWGYPVVDAAPGVELWTWFKPDAVDVDRQWRELANALSGLLCASLNFIDASNTLSPEYSLRPAGIVEHLPLNASHLRYAALPREIVCTENLTPWKKLLPCDSKKGLASLLNSGSIHNTRYHSLGLHLRPVCTDARCTRSTVELRQSVSLVYDYLMLGTKNWSFRKLFGQGLLEACPLATTSDIYVDVTANSTGSPFKLAPAPTETLTSRRGGDERKLARYDVTQLRGHVVNVAATYPAREPLAWQAPPPLHANQYIAGFGQQFGEIVTKIYNNHWASLDVVLLENLPWYVPVYLHTLRVHSDGRRQQPVHQRFVPGKQRVRPYYLELLLRLPPRSVTVVAIDFDYVFLKWQEYPPDANHGFYIGSSIVSAYLPVARNYSGLPHDGTLLASSFNASRAGYLVQVRTETLLITLPTPDFSMPYNVICLACTVVALAFGPLHNITTKRLVLKVPTRTSLVDRLKRFCGGKVKAE